MSSTAVGNMTNENPTPARGQVVTALVRSLIGRGIIIGLLLALYIACWGGADDFSRTFSRAIAILLAIAVFDIGFGSAVIAAFRSEEPVDALPAGKVYGTRLGRFYFVVFLPGSVEQVLVSRVEPDTNREHTKTLGVSRNPFCGPDALGRTRVIRLAAPTSVVRLEPAKAKLKTSGLEGGLPKSLH